MRKNNFIYQILSLLLLLGTGTRVCAQSNSDFTPTNMQGYSFTPQNQGFASPQTAEFVKYGNINMNYYNGLLDFEIPLMDYKDPAFELSASIRYISDGFKPGRRPSVVGNNWVLNAGGAITRNVVGYPDDIRNCRDIKQGIHTSDGLLVGIRDGIFKAYSKADLFNLKMELASYTPPYKELAHDMAPDIFEFNSGRHHGKFIIDNSGNARCISGGGYRIDISQMAVQNFTLNGTPASSVINITTPDGYLYTFGGGTSLLEYTIPNNPQGLTKKPVQISSWYLRSIKNLARLRTVYFEYQSHTQKNKYHLFLSSLESGMSNSPSMIHFANKKHLLVEDKVYTPILNKITIDDINIDFTIKTLPVNFWGDSEDSNLLYLSDVTMKKSINTIKSYHLDYQVQGKYFFLQKLTANNLSANPAIYKFDYETTLSLPDPLTTSTDHWGFWTGKYEAIDNVDTFFDSNFLTRKSVNTNVCSCTLLKHVTYPTGGEENIRYEYNRYLYFQKKSTSGFGWSLNSQTYATPLGGSRVKELSIYNPDTGRKSRRSFTYTDPYDNESGAINELPRYSVPAENIVGMNLVLGGPNIYKNVTVSSMSSSSIGRLNNISEYPIGYAYVTETFDDGSYDRYHYSSFLDTPDNGELNAYIIKNPSIIRRDFTDFQIMDKALNYTANDYSAFRGKILLKETYNNSNKKVAMEEYAYNSNSAKSKYEVSVTFNSACFLANKVFTTPCLMTQETLTDENGVKTVHQFEYNDYGFVTQKEMVNSNGDQVYLKYVYPDKSSKLYPDEHYGNLARMNCLEEPVAIIKSIRKAGETERKIVKAIQCLYEPFANCGFQKRSLITFRMKEPLPENTDFGSSESILNLTENVEAYDNYDYYGNRITLRANSETTIYLWSYRGTQLVAEVKGATYQEVKTALGRSPELYSMDGEPRIQQLEDLRQLLPHAHVTIYDYEPQIGVKHTSNPAGKASYFQFDRHQRLEKLFRTGESGELQLMEYNKYHYSNH